MGEIDGVVLVEKRVFRDLSSPAFTDEERERVLDDLDTIEKRAKEQLDDS
jgi:hypothetical protein